MSEERSRNDMNRRVAELLGWNAAFNFTTDANQVDAVVREWCGDDVLKMARWGLELFKVVFPGAGDTMAVSLRLAGNMAIATPEQKIAALLAAADALAKVDGGGGA